MKLKEYILATLYKCAGFKVTPQKSNTDAKNIRKKLVDWAILKSFYWLPEDQYSSKLLEQFHGNGGIVFGCRGLMARDQSSGLWDLKDNFGEYYSGYSTDPVALKGYIRHMSNARIKTHTTLCALSGLRFMTNNLERFDNGVEVVMVHHDVARAQTNPRLYWNSEADLDDEDDDHEGCWKLTPPPPPRPKYGRLQGYHSGLRTWNHASSDDSIANNKLYGIELEIYANNRNEVCELAGQNELLSEEDGSLDGGHGVEIIGPPLTIEQIKDTSGQWLQFLDSIQGKAKGYMAGGGRNYGMHISVNRLHMEKAHAARMVVFIHRNQSLCEHVARRGSCNWCNYDENSAKNYIDRDSAEGERYHALAIRGRKRLEMRIFRSNIKPEGFLRNVEFTDAVLEYTRLANLQELGVHKFLSWLHKNRKNYPHLYKDLCKGKKFLSALTPKWSVRWQPPKGEDTQITQLIRRKKRKAIAALANATQD